MLVFFLGEGLSVLTFNCFCLIYSKIGFYFLPQQKMSLHVTRGGFSFFLSETCVKFDWFIADISVVVLSPRCLSGESNWRMTRDLRRFYYFLMCLYVDVFLQIR